jgi:hypothetical protein
VGCCVRTALVITVDSSPFSTLRFNVPYVSAVTTITASVSRSDRKWPRVGRSRVAEPHALIFIIGAGGDAERVDTRFPGVVPCGNCGFDGIPQATWPNRRYGLSYRDVEELLAERGIEVDHVTIYRWVQRFTPLLIDTARPHRHAPGNRWFVDET